MVLQLVLLWCSACAMPSELNEKKRCARIIAWFVSRLFPILICSEPVVPLSVPASNGCMTILASYCNLTDVAYSFLLSALWLKLQ